MKLAVFTPLNPARSGISDYSEALLPELAKHVDVEIFIDDGYEPCGFAGDARLRIRNHREYRPHEFDETLFQLGNNPYHVYIRDALRKHRGIVLLHEANLHHLIAAATISRDDWDGYIREVEHEGGPGALEHAQRARALEVGPDYDGLALNRRVLESAKAAIVHSPFMARQVADAVADLPTAVIPHGAWIPEVNRNRYRGELGLDESQPLIGIFGFLKPYKRIREALQAMRRLAAVEPRAVMILVGEEHSDLPVRRMIEDYGLSENVRVLGYTPMDEFVQYIGACDICLNLRYPTAGETSGTLLRALGLGRAVIVSDVGAFSDLPDEICLKVAVGDDEEDLLFEYLSWLISKPEAARALGARARLHVASECSWPQVAEQFAETIRAVHEGRSLAPGLAPADEAESEPGPSPSASRPRQTAEPASAPEPRAEDETAAAIRSWVHNRAADAVYVETHLTRLVRTLEITPRGGPQDAVLEMGAYMHITPVLASEHGYGEVRGCYLGPLGKVDHRKVTSSAGGVFECEVDLFDAEKDRYPYPDGRFATLLCCELLEHLYEDPMHMMAEANRILREGGRFVLSTPNACSARAIAAMLLGYHPGLFHHYVIPDEEGKRDPRHAREYAPRDVQALLEAAGFEVEQLETGPYLAVESLEHDWIARLLDRYQLPDNLRDDAIYAVGRKVGPVRERYPAALYAGGAA